jgi:corrinoid protein of di/trimethylamine methyltransferase
MRTLNENCSASRREPSRVVKNDGRDETSRTGRGGKGDCSKEKNMSEEILRKLKQAIVDGEDVEAEQLARQGLDRGFDPMTLVDEALTPGINRVGELFANGTYFIPNLVIAGDAMKAAFAVLEPVLTAGRVQDAVLGHVVLGTVEGDVHEIGKTLVGTMLTANGFRVTDIGADRTADDFVAAVRENQATIVGASALMTTTMLEQKKIIEALEEAGLRDQVKVLVGGSPVSQAWADQIGADGYAQDAISTVDLALRLTHAPA